LAAKEAQVTPDFSSSSSSSGGSTHSFTVAMAVQQGMQKSIEMQALKYILEHGTEEQKATAMNKLLGMTENVLVFN
jgi:hypothetical protein